nr:hypothetical protein [Serratia bockelmannii]
MTGLVHFEYAPPRSWEQFEELCADLFEVMWSDPNLVRHGRAGQVQNGVDIIAARGGIYPVGLQCKKKAKWPEKDITLSEVKSEIEKAEKFNPPLKEFYIITTASADAKLQGKLREINVSREKNGGFQVQVLFWGEIIRKVALYPMVAKKHFSVGSTLNEFSPLLSTWYTVDGKVELGNKEWSIAVRELFEDFYDWPTGHVILRQRETDELIKKINGLENGFVQGATREGIVELRKELRRMKEVERELQEIIHNIFKNRKLKFYIFDLPEDEEDAPVILRAIIEDRLSLKDISRRLAKIKICPPTSELRTRRHPPLRIALECFNVYLSGDEYQEILSAELSFSDKYHGNKICQVVSELPSSIRRKIAIPSLIRWLHRIVIEDKLKLEELETAGYLDIDVWKYKL